MWAIIRSMSFVICLTQIHMVWANMPQTPPNLFFFGSEKWGAPKIFTNFYDSIVFFVEEHGHISKGGMSPINLLEMVHSYRKLSWISRSIILETDLKWLYGDSWVDILSSRSCSSESTRKLIGKLFKAWPSDVPNPGFLMGSNVSTAEPLKGTSTL